MSFIITHRRVTVVVISDHYNVILVKIKKMSSLNEDQIKSKLIRLCSGITSDLLESTQSNPPRPNINHAPKRTHGLDQENRKIMYKNALRYIPKKYHDKFLKTFKTEVDTFGHIYMHDFRPNYIEIKAYPLHLYPAKTQQGASMMLMIMNNLSDAIAQYPDELVTYGGNGQVFSNWAQFLLVMNYLSRLTDEQTLVLYSGHPLGMFPAPKSGPRLVLTNGMVIPNYSSREEYEKMFALGVTQYGQMTAGSYCYIGPQGIVHGTTLTVMNAGRKYLKTESLSGRVFLTSGLGGMSGAQAKAAKIAGCVGVISEIDPLALIKRHEQGWLDTYTSDLDELFKQIEKAQEKGVGTSIGYLGNVLDIWERLVEIHKETGKVIVELGSDQTSCHNVEGGGYMPKGYGFEEGQKLLEEEPKEFLRKVRISLKQHMDAIEYLSENAGLYFWDYGNAFLLECSRSGSNITLGGSSGNSVKFKYPSYVQHIMGDIFSMGFGPFRWVCTSCDEKDLAKTDEISLKVMRELASKAPEREAQQYRDNIKWIEEAAVNKLVVGSQARILYSNQLGRVKIALAFNEAIKNGEIIAPIVLSRDHHDVSGTDSPFRETSNIYDGSAFCADMSVHNFVGDSFRGATWISLHNGGGCGWGEVMNGGFGLLLDGSEDAHSRANNMLNWDVSNGVARRAWSGNENAYDTIRDTMEKDNNLVVTLPESVDDKLFEGLDI